MSALDDARLPLGQAIGQVSGLLDRGVRQVAVRGASESALALFVDQLCAVRGEAEKPLVVVVPTDDEARSLVGEMRFFLGAHDGAELAKAPRVMHLPYDDLSPWAEVTPDRRALLSRMAILFRLSQRMMGDVLVAAAPALARRVVPRQGFCKLIDLVQAEQEIDRDRLVALLLAAGYERTAVVDDPGTFAVRGGVVDVFVPIFRYPARLELDGDLVEKIRLFDPATQRTLRAVEEIFIHPCREVVPTEGHRLRERILEAGDRAHQASSKTRQLLERLDKGEDFFGKELLAPAFHDGLRSIGEYLSDDRLMVVVDPSRCVDEVAAIWESAEPAYEAAMAEHRVVFSPGDYFLTADEVAGLWQNARCIAAEPLELHDDVRPSVRLQVEEHRQLEQELHRSRTEKHEELMKPLVAQLARWRDDGVRTLLCAVNLQHGERLESLLKGYGVRPKLSREPGLVNILDQGAERGAPEIVLGALHRGFLLPGDKVAIVAEEEIFGRKAVRRPTRPPKGGLRQGTLDKLDVGSFVVHNVHGVGVYRGLVKMPLRANAGGGRPPMVDCVQVEYEGGALYLPVWRLNELAPWKGGEGGKPRIDKLGGQTWEKTRARVTVEVRRLAEELLQLYAQRQSLPGHAMTLRPEMAVMFSEFEATFPFEETPDQQKAIDDVLADLEKPRPMDRLVCGDVGYGKTEVALRAALKVVFAGHQAAVLAPTTVLVEQHAQTLRARYAGLPVRVESLSRFQSKAEQTAVLRDLAEGKIDVVVGTHRLLSADVRWKSLGLLVIDEEQRFGVTHKERLKKMRTQVDVLTMSATPIPRTLHMALMGVRDLSIITTPPADRLAIRTFVARSNDQLIIDGIKKELARGGQVFFVHNRVEDIGEVASKLRELLPDVRLLVGHGQMPPEELERVMVDFVDGKADVLLCTTIIESGIDIPRANTMFVDRADCFGLAQLYQLRGRIGRSKDRAFCYLLIPPQDNVTADAKARLEILQRFTELGAGFQIASYDLELRGAGDLLGDKQSGVIAAVGFDAYTQLLEEAVASLEGRAITSERDPELVCDLPAFIPDDYLPDVGQRLDFYRRFSAALDEEEIAGLVAELADRYGPPPDEVGLLADLMRIKALGRRLQCKTIELGETRFAVALDERTPLRPDAVMKLVQKKNAQWRLSPDMRLTRTLNDAERAARLPVAKQLLMELIGLA